MRDIFERRPVAILRRARSGGRDRGVHQLNTGGGKFALDGCDGAVEVDGAAGIAEDHGGQTEAAGIEGGVADAVVVGEAGEEDAVEAAFAQISGEAGGGGAVVFKEGGVGVDGRGGNLCAG